EDDCHLPVVDARCRYKSPAYYDEEIVVRTELRNLRGSLMHFGYDILRQSDRTVLAEAETTHIVVNARMEKRQLPERYRSTLEALARRALSEIKHLHFGLGPLSYWHAQRNPRLPHRGNRCAFPLVPVLRPQIEAASIRGSRLD